MSTPPFEQFVATLEELERTMTKGRWRPTTAYERDMGFGDVCAVEAMTPNMLTEAVRDVGLNEAHAHGIAHLKNANPTVIAMLKAAMKELRGIVEYWNGAPESAVDAIETVADRAHDCLAHLNTLAQEALGTKGEK